VNHIPKLLVLGSSFPGSKAGGGVVRDEILKRYPRDRYVCFSVNSQDRLAATEETPESLRGVPCRIGPLAPRLQWRGARFYSPWLRALGFYGLAPWRTRQAVSFGRRHGVELIWAELQGAAVVIAQKVAAGLGVPFVGTVWDDPDGWLTDGGYDRLSRNLLRRRFREALRGARHLSTAGEAMQAAYQQEYGVRSVILRHGFEVPVAPAEPRRSNAEVVIGFVGNAYGRDAWTAFLGALSTLNASGTLARIKLRVFGPPFPYRRDQVEIEVKGWQPAEVMLKEIAATDFCYLQYWFDPKKRRHAELSFPNKFETYLAAGRPIFYHGPAYAGIARTVRTYGVGTCVHSLDQEEIAAVVQRLVQDPARREKYQQAALSAFHAEFNAAQMMKNFAELIGVDPALLQSQAAREQGNSG
jgi:glycosyltransferase involved in cell wall biosynthesis